ncbi:2'-5' RNA ligase [Desulfocucumis palustris]|uniref:RNA 2',3'-cyclic phosphodiesterase n=1 Tax=Desulfocucumis palustris TaxID=1898651 RepID=A0A2L2XBY8_9FIRM|nr:RNA 2',3'-cyclic phosphodiesterase [Desulfocucumis palustris]GBF33735.1 2'-5' RNA ligase [Desulfocucumis palustris]
MAQNARLFWAVNITDELKEKIDSFSREMRLPGLDARWVARESLHLTLAFLGDTDVNRIVPMVTEVERRLAGFIPFQIQFGGAGFFPSSGSPRVFWLGVGGEIDRLKKLQREVLTGLKAAGLAPDTRPFSPHLTLARIKSPAGVSLLRSRALEAGHNEIEGILRVDSVELMQSRLTPGGAIYSVVASLNFKAG